MSGLNRLTICGLTSENGPAMVTTMPGGRRSASGRSMMTRVTAAPGIGDRLRDDRLLSNLGGIQGTREADT